jgi:hypothetical protein
MPGVSDTQPLDSRPDWVAANGLVDVGRAVAALAEAGIPLLAYELEGARLSDAFLSMTESG